MEHNGRMQDGIRLDHRATQTEQSRFVKQFGLQRSGTNATKAMIEVNFPECVMLSGASGDKHAATSWSTMAELIRKTGHADHDMTQMQFERFLSSFARREICFVFNIKEPVSWLCSFYRYHRKKVLYKDPEANFPFSSALAERCLASWRERILSWLQFARENESHSVVVQHESLLRAPKLIVEEIGKRFSLPLPDDLEVFDVGYARRGIDSQHGYDLIDPKKTFDRSYHLEGGWVKDMPASILEMSSNFSLEFFCRESVD